MTKGAGIGFLLIALLSLAAPAAADEFYLKNGTRIIGKFVGFENDAFRVETDFGIAIIYRDKIDRIIFDKTSSTTSVRDRKRLSELSKKKVDVPRIALEASDQALPAVEDPDLRQPGVPRPARSRMGSVIDPSPIPDQVVERVSTTQYINETYRFQMYKPPTWRSYPEMVQPGSLLIAALGTPDESTLVLIGRERYPGDLTIYARLAEDSLKATYEGYRLLAEGSAQIGNNPAYQRSFTGRAEGRVWSGTALYFRHGLDFFTLLAVTAKTDDSGLQQVVLRRVVRSLTFLPDDTARTQTSAVR